MQHVLIMVFQLGGLYWLSGRVHQRFMRLFYRALASHSRVVWAIDILFWPGVLVHELSHLVVARLLLVKAGGLTLIPKVQTDGSIVMGSVQLPATDLLRLTLIGVAPVYVGLAFIFGMMWVGNDYHLWEFYWWWVAVGFAMFEVGNSLFTSASDMKGALKLSILLAIVGGILFWMGWRPSLGWVGPWLNNYNGILAQAERWLWVPVGVDIGVLGLFLISAVLFRRRPFN